MVVGRNIENPEQGKRGDLTYNFWVTDMSKNNVLIPNVSPKADGTIPEKAQHILLGMGCWLRSTVRRFTAQLRGSSQARARPN